jgi:hypothetical protein
MSDIHRWRAFSLLAVAFFMTIVDLTIVNVALPTIGRKLHVAEANLQWVVTAYGLTFGVGSRSRGPLTEAQIEAHLDTVEASQHDDGGWMFDWLAWSPAQTTAWRGIVTIRAPTWLPDNRRL